MIVVTANFVITTTNLPVSFVFFLNANDVRITAPSCFLQLEVFGTLLQKHQPLRASNKKDAPHCKKKKKQLSA